MNNIDLVTLNAISGVEWLSVSILVFTYFYFQINLSYKTKKSRYRKLLLSAANLIIPTATSLLILEPKIRDDHNENNKNNVIELLTYSENAPSYLVSELSTLKNNQFVTQEAVSGLTAKELDQAVNKNNNTLAKIVKEPRQIFQSKQPRIIHSLSIEGDGLDAREAADMILSGSLRVKEIQYLKPKPTIGFHSTHWRSQLTIGEELAIASKIAINREKLNTDNSFILSARLIDPVGSAIDEILVGSQSSVKFSAVPKTPGLHQYQIQLLADAKIIATEFIPVQVLKSDPIKLLVLQSSPSFETKQVQNWAAKHNSIVVINSSISANISHTKTINILQDDKLGLKEKFKDIQLSQNSFSYFDLLMIDERRYQNLSKQEQSELRTSASNGLGIIMLAQNNRINNKNTTQEIEDKILPSWLEIEPLDSSNEAIINLTDFSSSNFIVGTSRTPVTLTGKSISPSRKLHALKSSYKTLVTSHVGKPLVVNYQLGLGRISLSIVKNTFRWASNGNSLFHAQYWQHLIQNTARKNAAKLSWMSIDDTTLSSDDSQYYTVGTRSKLCFISRSKNKNIKATIKVVGSNQNDKKLLLNPSATIKTKFCGYFWPKNGGWHQIDVKQTSSKNKVIDRGSLFFYVYQPDSWKSQRQLIKFEATEQFVKQVNRLETNDHNSSVVGYKNISPWILWTLIVFGLTIIWVEEKLWEFSDN